MEPTNIVPFKGKSYVNYSEIQAIYVQLSNLIATYGAREVAKVLLYMIKTGARYGNVQERG